MLNPFAPIDPYRDLKLGDAPDLLKLSPIPEPKFNLR
jgi:hypothetical protein